MSHTTLAAAAGALFLLACAHERVEQRGDCWITKRESRLGDTRETISACRPNAPAWSPDPLVRAIEDCLYQEQIARYDESIRPSEKKDTRPVERCLEHAQKLALERIDGLQREVAAAAARAARMADENRELRQTILACVEKSPQAIAEARATTDSTSGANTTQTAEKVDRRPRKPRAPEVPLAPAPAVTPTSGSPGCVQDAKTTTGATPRLR